MELYRDDRAELERLAELQATKATQEEVFHPEVGHEVVREAGRHRDGARRRRAAAASRRRRLRLRDRQGHGRAGAEASASSRDLYRALRPEALATLIYMTVPGPRDQRRQGRAERHQHGPRPAVPGRPRRGQRPGDRRLLAAHDRLLLRHRAQVLERPPGRGVPVHARPPPRPRRHRLRLRARRDPRHGLATKARRRCSELGRRRPRSGVLDGEDVAVLHHVVAALDAQAGPRSRAARVAAALDQRAPRGSPRP